MRALPSIVRPSSSRSFRTACRGCHGVCQVLVHLDTAGRVTRITGDPDSPTSRGYICPKGTHAAELLYHPDRLLKPRMRVGERGKGRWRDISWEDAINQMVSTFDRIRHESGPEFIAIAQGTGRPHTEFTGRFAHALGSPNMVGPGHNCFVPRTICATITLGWFPAPDIYGHGGSLPRCIMVLGSNIMATGAADGYCGGMMNRALKQAQSVIVIDPRATPSARQAELHLALRPGTDCALLLAMLHVIIRDQIYDADFVAQYCVGFDELAAHVQPFSPAWAEPLTRVPAALIEQTARTFASTKPAALLWGNGIDGSTCAFQTARAVFLLLAICGTLDVPGGMVRWLPPANIRHKSPLLNPHEVRAMHLLAPEQRAKKIGSRFPFCPGAHAPSFWQACVSGQPYRPRALWMMGTNPMLTQTRGDLTREALRNHLEFVVTSDFFMTPAAEYSDLVLPTLHWLEQDDVVYFHKIWCVLARQQLVHQGESRDDRDVILEIAHRLGLTEAFPWENRQAYLEWLLEPAGLSFADFTAQGIIWGEMRYHKHVSEGFPTPSGKVELVSSLMASMGLDALPVYTEPPLSPLSRPDLAKQYPFILMTGCKLLPFFHSEGRSQPSLRRLHPHPRTDMHPDTARALDLDEGQQVLVSTPYGTQEFLLHYDEHLPRDVVHVEHAWWFPEEPGPDHGCLRSNVNLLLGHDHFDPHSGAEPLKNTLCQVTAKH